MTFPSKLVQDHHDTWTSSRYSWLNDLLLKVLKRSTMKHLTFQTSSSIAPAEDSSLSQQIGLEFEILDPKNCLVSKVKDEGRLGHS